MISCYKFLLLFALLGLLTAKPCHAQDTTKSKQDMDHVTVDEIPLPPQGYSDFLFNNIHYPDSAIMAKAEGIVIVMAVVNTDGKLSDIKVYSDHVGHGCAEEAIRVVKLMPRWTPAKAKGEPVRTYCKIPIAFYLKKQN